MPLRLRFDDEEGSGACRFAVSALWETLEAVRTLDRPHRHGHHLPWLRRIRHAAAGLDLSVLWLLMPRAGRAPGFLRPAPDGPYPPIEEELERVRATDPQTAHDDLAATLACTPGGADTPQGRALLNDPARTVRDVADLTGLAWRAVLEPHWPRLRDLLEADAAFHARRLADGGPSRLFDGLHPAVTWSGGELTVESPQERSLPADGRGLLLVPSVFARPDVVCGFDGPGPPSLLYPARGTAALWTHPHGEGVPESLARLLGKGRAAVLTALAEPSTTTALAQRLQLAPSSVSAHLSALRDSGLLTSQRCGHQVLYERTPLGIALAAG
ncbi:ArsR/SmtB family transcription factor [Streptomyces meridianus]|uniref:DUF5937 family protein n=1 Tax=Streptomyces meridianus TaxID=2938945 RepID=A0ABT0X6I0_9ACTN|nr:DUF5937 family protein [Streptomyces meridianus]MCM2578131.1 DUF5937 family protein [Streptomyces meridianus]